MVGSSNFGSWDGHWGDDLVVKTYGNSMRYDEVEWKKNPPLGMVWIPPIKMATGGWCRWPIFFLPDMGFDGVWWRSGINSEINSGINSGIWVRGKWLGLNRGVLSDMGGISMRILGHSWDLMGFKREKMVTSWYTSMYIYICACICRKPSICFSVFTPTGKTYCAVSHVQCASEK